MLQNLAQAVCFNVRTAWKKKYVSQLIIFVYASVRVRVPMCFITCLIIICVGGWLSWDRTFQVL